MQAVCHLFGPLSWLSKGKAYEENKAVDSDTFVQRKIVANPHLTSTWLGLCKAHLISTPKPSCDPDPFVGFPYPVARTGVPQPRRQSSFRTRSCAFSPSANEGPSRQAEEPQAACPVTRLKGFSVTTQSGTGPIAFTPAVATWTSCSAVPPETPTAPMKYLLRC